MALKEYEKQALLNIATFNRKPYKESTQEKLIYMELEKKKSKFVKVSNFDTRNFCNSDS